MRLSGALGYGNLPLSHTIEAFRPTLLELTSTRRVSAATQGAHINLCRVSALRHKAARTGALCQVGIACAAEISRSHALARNVSNELA